MISLPECSVYTEYKPVESSEKWGETFIILGFANFVDQKIGNEIFFVTFLTVN